MVVTHGLKVDVIHGVLGCHSLSVVVPQHLAQQVKSLVTHQLVVLRVDELGPWLARDGVLGEDVFVVGVESESILVEVSVELLRAEDLGNLDELVVVITALEEGLTLEDHTCKHAAQRPDIKRVVVGLEVNKELGSLEVSGSDAHVVLLVRVVELGQTPINEAQLAVRVVNHDVVRLHVTVHNALRVAIVESFEDLKHVEANVEVVEALVKFAEVGVTRVNKFSDDRGSLSQGVTDDINKLDNVDTVLQGLQDLDLTSDLVLLNYWSKAGKRSDDWDKAGNKKKNGDCFA